MADVSPSADQFRQAYSQQPPWEIGHLQPALAAVADQIQGSVLDAGCGTGDCALFFAARGQVVYGVDFVPEVIAQAKAKAAAQGLDVCFLAMDALAPSALQHLIAGVHIVEAAEGLLNAPPAQKLTS